MGKNNENLKLGATEQDNTCVDYQIPYEIVLKTLPSEQIQSYYKTYDYPKQPVLFSDVRNEQERELSKRNYIRNKTKKFLIKKCQNGETLRLLYELLKKELENVYNTTNSDYKKLFQLQDSLLYIGYLLGDYTLNKYKGTTLDPLLYNDWTGRGLEADAKLLKEWHIRETPEVREYFKSYVNSEGFNRILNNLNKWWKNRHPYRKFYLSSEINKTKRYTQKHLPPVVFSLDMYAELSWYQPIQHAAFVGDRMSKAWNDDEYAFTYDHALGHETAHGMGVTYTNGLKEALDQNQNTKINQHDEYRSEKHADLWGLRYMLYKEGIYDSRSSLDITIDQIKKLREKYPTLRPFQQMTDEQLQFQLNNVAMIDLENSGIDFAKMGIKIKKSNRGKFTDYCGGKVTNECIKRGKNSPNPKIRKRATFAANSRLWKHQKGGPVENFRERSRKEYKARPKGLDNVVASELNDSIQTSNYFIQNVPIYPTAIKNNNFMGLLNVGLYSSPLYFRGFNADKAEAIKKYGKEKGLSDNLIATLIESAWRESNLNARSHGNAHGYWQFSKDKKAGTYDNYVNWLNGREDNLKSQMDYLLDEYMPKRDDGVNRFGYKKVWTNPKSSLEELAEYFLFEVEAPNEKHELLDRTKRAVKTIKSLL